MHWEFAPKTGTAGAIATERNIQAQHEIKKICKRPHNGCSYHAFLCPSFTLANWVFNYSTQNRYTAHAVATHKVCAMRI